MGELINMIFSKPITFVVGVMAVIVTSIPSLLNVNEIADKIFQIPITIMVSGLTAFLVAYINNKMQFFGKLYVYPWLTQVITAPKLIIGNSNESVGTDDDRYIEPFTIIKCICFNSKKIPVYLTNFHIEMKVQGRKKPHIISVCDPKPHNVEVGGISIGGTLSVPPQVINPLVLHEIVFRLKINHEIAVCFPLTLVCLNEKHIKERFKLTDGKNISKIKHMEPKQHYKDTISKWLDNNPERL